MDEPTKRRWDVVFAAIAAIMAAIGLIIGAWQFTSSQREEARQEFERGLWLARRESCVSLAENIGGILVSLGLDGNERDEARLKAEHRKYEEGYYGTLLLLNNAQIDSSANEFKRSLSRHQRGYQEAVAVRQAGEQLLLHCSELLEAADPTKDES